MKVETLTPVIGATVQGVQLSDMVRDDALFHTIHELWMEHLVLFFRDQALSPQEQLALGKRFGELHIHPAAPYVDGNPALMKIHADKDSKRNNGDVWHSDVSADQEPPMASILRLHTVPSQGGDTLWANMYAVYESLSSVMQEQLNGLQALHHMSYEGFYGDHDPQRQTPEAVHPVVRTHPVTARQALRSGEVVSPLPGPKGFGGNLRSLGQCPNVDSSLSFFHGGLNLSKNISFAKDNC